MNVPSNVPWTGQHEIEAVAKAITEGHLSGGGPVSARVQRQMEKIFCVRHVLLTTSCTHAMELALMAAGIGPGDEVITSSFTFSSTANAVVLQGATPVFAEIDAVTLNIDPEDIERKITARTRGIMPVHYNGVSCQMDAIMSLAEKHGLVVIEDAAQGVGAKYYDRFLGTLGHAGCYSFHGTKNITCGEGGAFLTNDDDLFQRAEIIREKGTNRQAFLRGEVDKYTWVNKGSSYVLSDILAAFLESQFRRMDDILAARKVRYWRYMEGLDSLAAAGKIHLPVIPNRCSTNYHIFFLRTQTLEQRDSLLHGLKEMGVHATFHYVPLHNAPYGRKLNLDLSLPITDHASNTLLRLPLYPQLTKEAQDYVIRCVHKIAGSWPD